MVCQSLVKFFRFVCAGKKHGESVVVSFDSAFEESLKFLCELGMSRELRTGQKDTTLTLLHWYWFWKELNISDVGIHQTNNDGGTFERGSG